MPSLSNMLIIVAYAILSAAVAIGAREVWPLDDVTTALTGVSCFLLGMQFQSAVFRIQERRIFENDLVESRRATLVLAQDVEVLKSELKQADEALEESISKRSKKIIAEVRVLESLMKQLADGLERKARTAALEAVEEVENARAAGDATAVSKLISSIENSLADLDPEEARRTRDDLLDSLSEEELLEVIRASLNDNLVDLYLQPIVALPGRDTVFYEALTRLRSQSGEMILPTQYLEVAGQAGLMSVIDNLLLFRSLQLVRRIAEQEASISIVCNIALSSVQDGDFFPHFLEFMEINSDLESNLVFEFSQASFEAFGAEERERIGRLSALGFRMSLDGVTSLDLDLVELRQNNFRFLKVRSDLLAATLETPGGEEQLQDFQDLLGQYAIELVIERIEEQASVERAEALGIGLGQGFMFGEPRPMEEIEARIQSDRTPVSLFGAQDEIDPDQPRLAYRGR